MRRGLGRVAMVAVAAVGTVGGGLVSGSATDASAASVVTPGPSPAGRQAPTILPQRTQFGRPVVGLAPRVPLSRHPFQFPGQGDCGNGSHFCWTPGEPVVAVGPIDLVETVNTSAAVYDKASGHQLAFFDFATFWGSSNSECVDPRAIYLPGDDRFAVSCTDITPNMTNTVRFAISKSGDPTGGWWKYSAGSVFLDQDKIEATSDKFIIAGNGSGEQMFVFNKADVLAGVANPTVSQVAATQSNIYQAAVEQTYSSNGYFVSSYPNGSLLLATISGTPAAGNVAVTETVVAPSSYPAPQEPSVPGGSIGNGDLDGRVYDAVFEQEASDNKAVVQYSSARECGVRTCITNGRIDLSGASPVLAYDRLIGEPGYDYTYGAVGLNAAGDVFEAYSRSDTANTPSAAVVGAGFDVVLQPNVAGTTSCDSGQNPPCDERWGDYLGAAIDPADPSAVWVTGLYQLTNGGYSWATIIQKVSASAFSVPAATTGAATGVTSTGATVAGTVNPNGVNSSYHVDYGLTSGYDTATASQPAGSGSGPVPVSVPLTGLAPGTLYHYRVVATSSAGDGVGNDQTFFTPGPPAVTTEAASSIVGRTATLNGTVNPTGADTTASFEWGTTTSYGSTTSGQDLGSGTTTVPVFANLTGLTPGLVYHFRLDASNSVAAVDGADQLFTAPPLPIATTTQPTKIGPTGATLGGSVNPQGQATTYDFEWGLDTSYGSTTPSQSAGSGGRAVKVTAPLTGLTPGTTYHFRVVATNASGVANGADRMFVTTPPPAASTGSATITGAHSATLGGTLNPRGIDTTWLFQWGLDATYGQTTATRDAGKGTKPVTVSAGLGGLATGTTYHYRLVANSAAGTTDGVDKTFATPAPPSAVTDPATAVTSAGATVNGRVNPHGIDATYLFDYGLTVSYGHTTPVADAGSGTSTVAVSAGLTGLTAATVYHYRLVATSGAGRTDGADRMFTTSAGPAAGTVTAALVSYRLPSGKVME